MRLRPWQAAGLCEAHDNGGLFAQAGLGMGKTLFSALVSIVMEAKRPLLLVPADLHGTTNSKTVRDFRKLRKDWKAVPIRIETYNKLSTTNKEGVRSLDLEKFNPDLIILDEAQALKDPKSKRTRYFRRYIRERRKQGLPVKLIALSGTMAKRSIRDFAHLLDWCLGEGSPLPRDEFDLIFWADAIDEKTGQRDIDPVEPGALLSLCGPEEKDLDDRIAARRAVGRRIFETPGCMSLGSDVGASCKLRIECHEIPVPPAVEAAFKHLKTTWTTPGGVQVCDGLGMRSHSREIACGFFYKWKYPAPQAWKYARSAWCSAVRELIGTNRRGLDSEKDVALEIQQFARSGRAHPLAEVYREWQKQKPTFEPETIPVWLSDDALHYAIHWAKNPGLVWTEHVAVGERLSELSGLPYYGPKGFDKKKRYIEDHKPGSSAIASIASNHKGRNLQGIWSRSLYTSFPATGYISEQSIGRIHRPGQLADEVVVDIMISCREQLLGFEQTIRDAGFHTDALQSAFKLGTSSPRIFDPQPLDKSSSGWQSTSNSVAIVVPTFAAHGWAWKEPARISREAQSA